MKITSNSRWLLFLLAFAEVLLAVVSARAIGEWVLYKAAVAIIPDPRVVFPYASINGHSMRLVLDTGSPFVVLLDSAANRSELKFPTPLKVDITAPAFNPHDTLSLSDPALVKLGDLAFTTQLPVLNTSWSDRETLNFAGIIGWPEVRDNLLVFDSAKHTVSTVNELPQETAGWLKLKVRPYGKLLLETLLPGGKTGVILVDTGSPEGVGLVPELYRAWLATHPNVEKTTRTHSIFGIKITISTDAAVNDVTLGALTLGNVSVHEEDVGEVGSINDLCGTIGLEALEQMDLIVDGKNGFAYLRPKPVPTGGNPPGVQVGQTKNPHENDDWTVVNNAGLNEKVIMAGSVSMLGYNKQRNGDLDGAIAEYSQAIALDPQNPDAYSSRGDAEGDKHDYAGAIADYTLIIKLDPENSDAYHDRGTTRQNQGDFAGALADYGKVIELQPDDSTYPRLYSQVLQLQMGKAPAVFDAAVTGWKDGWTKDLGQFLLGKMDEQALLAAAKKKDEEPVAGQQCEAYYFIGMMRLRKGDEIGARNFFQKSLATGMKDYYEYEFARTELAQMGSVNKK